MRWDGAALRGVPILEEAAAVLTQDSWEVSPAASPNEQRVFVRESITKRGFWFFFSFSHPQTYGRSWL